MKQIILASSSPRRKELIQLLHMPWKAIPAVGEEISDETMPEGFVEGLSLHKAVEIYRGLSEEERKKSIVLGADTVVALEHQIMGKPRDHEDAYRMISNIAGRDHRALTGVTLIWCNASGEQQIHTFHEITHVYVNPMNHEEIEGYLATGNAYDKAGAYGIQSDFGKYIGKIEGDYLNVMGLPVPRIYQEMKQQSLL